MLFGRFLECEPNMNIELSDFCANASWQISHIYNTYKPFAI